MLAKLNSFLLDVILRICYSASSVTLDNFSTLFLYLPCLLRSLTRDFRQLKTNQTGQTYQTHQTHENNQKHIRHTRPNRHIQLLISAWSKPHSMGKLFSWYFFSVLLIWWTWNLLQINPRLFSANLSRLSFHLNSSLFPPKILEEEFSQNLNLSIPIKKRARLFCSLYFRGRFSCFL